MPQIGILDYETVYVIPCGLPSSGVVVCILMGETAGLCDVRLLASFANSEFESEFIFTSLYCTGLDVS